VCVGWGGAIVRFSGRYSMTSFLPPTIPKGVVCQLHLHYGILILLPILHVGKASVKGTVWKASARTVPDPSHRFRRISALSH
jgi:hypothetical protein